MKNGAANSAVPLTKENLMSRNSFGIAAAALASAAVLGFGGAALANADTAPSTSTSGTTSQSATDQPGQSGQPGQPGQARQGQPGGTQDTPVTGAEAQKVIDAVTAKNSGVTITEVRMDPDKSYDALGTKADGSRVMFDVSADLNTISEGGGPRGGGAGHGGPGGGPRGAQQGTQGSTAQAPTVTPTPSA